MSIKKEYYKNLANTVIKGFSKRFIEGHYCETIDEAKSVVSGRAYAQDKLVLDVYYNNIEYAKKSTWWTSDSSRFETVTYVGENSWIAEPKNKGASANFYNIKLSTSAVTELLNAGTPVVTLTFTGYNAPLTEITLEHDWSVFPAGAVKTASENMIKVTYTLTESMKTSAPNVMFYISHSANASFKITMTAEEFVCGNGWLAGVAEEVSGANCYPSYLGYEKQSYNIIFGNDSGTKQYQITAKAVNELLAKGFTKVKMTITLKDGEAFISCLSNAGGQVLSSKAKNTDSKTYTLTANTPILASFYIRKLNATEATNAGFSEIPPMTGFTVQLAGC